MTDDRDKKADYDFATAGETAPGRVPTSNSSAEVVSGGTTKKDKERSADATADLLRELNDARMQLCAQIDALQFVLDGLYEQRQNLDNQITALTNYLDEAKAGGEFKIGVDGYPENSMVRNAIKAIEQKTGGVFNAHDTDQASDFIRLGLIELQNERDGVDSEISITTEKLDKMYKTLDALDYLNEDAEVEGSNVAECLDRLEALVDDIEIKDAQTEQQAVYEAGLNLNLGIPSLN